ncbi:MAG: spore coat U domain-containing protein [Rubrivivax sp.]
MNRWSIRSFRCNAAARLLPALALVAAPQAWAASATGNFNVTATVQTSCAVSAADLAFGTYDAASATDTTATSTVTVTCSLLTPYNISLDSGTHASGSTRRLGSGASRLSYEIYRDVSMSNVFGTVAALLGVSGVGTGLAAPTTIYGKIPKNQAVVPGSYSDQITVTVDY